jgi:uncharacterized peroxidase-related enzyme
VDAVKRDWTDAALDHRQRAICAWAEKLTRSPGAMQAGDLAPLRAAGLDDEAILHLAEVVAYFNFINRIADGLGVDPEPFMAPPA